MSRFRVCLNTIALLAPLAAASCAGGQPQSPPALPGVGQPAPQSATIRSYALSASNGTGVKVTLQTSAALADSSVAFETESSGTRMRLSIGAGTCPAIPPIKFTNPFSFPITVGIIGFTVKLPCTPSAQLFGASFYQISPQPAFVSPAKIGDASSNGNTVTFSPTAKTVTLAAESISVLQILPEQSTQEIAMPVAPGSTTNLTANSPNLPTGMQFSYTTANPGAGTVYTVACFPAFDPVTNMLAQALQGVPLVGIPSFYCHITPVNVAAITFGQINTFNFVKPKPDRAIFEPDGTAQGFECTLANSCNVPQFSVPTNYTNFIGGNVNDLVICVPAAPNTDCNNFNNDPQGATRSQVPKRGDFQVLIADDPTYKPGTQAAPVPWDGLFHPVVSGPCKLSTAPDNDNSDAPRGYSDNGQTGTGPAAEIDVTPTGTGSCTITATEDGKYITDYSNPSSPQPRSAAVTVTITNSDPD